MNFSIGGNLKKLMKHAKVGTCEKTAHKTADILKEFKNR